MISPSVMDRFDPVKNEPEIQKVTRFIDARVLILLMDFALSTEGIERISTGFSLHISAKTDDYPVVSSVAGAMLDQVRFLNCWNKVLRLDSSVREDRILPLHRWSESMRLTGEYVWT